MSKPTVVVLDYGSGNVRSAVRSLERVGAEVTLTADKQAALNGNGLVVPGVGAFAAAMAGLRAVVASQGVFCSLYSDRASHFVHTPRGATKPRFGKNLGC